MNLITFWRPNKEYIGDVLEHGLGDFVINNGKAWYYIIPEKLKPSAHITLSEFLTKLICVWLDIVHGEIKPLDYLLGMGNSTTAIGWLCHSNFREQEENDINWIAKQKVARKLAELLLDSQSVLYSQWFSGAKNIITDSLS